MPDTLVIKTAAFTEADMLKLYKEGISQQWIAKLLGNDGFNRLFHSRLASEFTEGTDPVPAITGAEVSGGAVMVWQAFPDDDAFHTIDDSIDWNDRMIAFIGITATHATDISAALPGGASQESAAALKEGADGGAADGYMLAGSAVGSFSESLAIGVAYMGRAAAGATEVSPAPIVLHNMASVGGVSRKLIISVKSTGELQALKTTAGTEPPGGEFLLKGFILYSPPLGYADA